ncbi:uncharacterized protein BP5553_09436 [Venustampulla echinocandica]|uniref:Uncharacterized protein n=1 Tax=Venustampulla echinocandica TaxID=2656787 RepID=A0A370TCT1_9HELO|nr:uncharacterized protein BP5553_09436 [Venustampulla echinocandica]RDL32034.1 hypothetical protein BP5553_09436 [Venustampulla echinocandica]
MSLTTSTNESFQYYHRLAGSTSTIENIAVDIDLANNLWRVMKQNDTDTAHIWMSHDSKLPAQDSDPLQLPSVPTFFPILENEMYSGTFSSLSSEQPHMFIPYLYLAIPNMYAFFHNCNIEPFMRVIDTSNLEQDENEMKHVLESKWDSRSDDRVLMRTASFGHGRQDLSACAREGTVMSSIQEERLAGEGMMSAIRNYSSNTNEA